MTQRNRDLNSQPASATTAAALPALGAIRSMSDAELRSFLESVKEILEVREGRRGNKYEKVVTWRDLADLGIVVGDFNGARFSMRRFSGAGAVMVQGNGGYTSVSYEEFAQKIRETSLYRDLIRRLNDPARFDDLPIEVRNVLLNDIASEARQRGADIRRLETKIQESNRSVAILRDEVTAAVETAAAGVRTTAWAYAEPGRASAGLVTQVQSRLDNINGNTGVTLEQAMFTNTSLTGGLFGQYTLKIDANGKVAGFGLSNSASLAGVGTSAFIVMADKFAIVGSADSIPDPANPPTNRIPFGVDTVNNTIYLNGNVRINTGTGATLDSITRSVSISAPTQVFKYTGATPNPTTIALTRTLNGGLTGTTAWSVVNGTYSGSISGNVSSITITPSLMSSNCTFRVTVTSGSDTYTDDFTLVKVSDGTAGLDGLTIFMTNESHTLPTDTSDNVLSYAGASGNIKIYDGGSDVSTGNGAVYAYTGSYSGFSSAPSGTINASTGAYSISSGLSATADTAWVEYQVTYNSVVYGPFRFSIGKSKKGDTGLTGNTGTAGVRGSLTLYRTNASYTSTYNNGAGAGLPSYQAQATTEFQSATGSSTKVQGDTIYFTNGTNYATTLTWNGSAWALPGVVIDGNLLVTGTVSMAALTAGTATVAGAAGTVKMATSGNNFGANVPLAVERTTNTENALVVSDAASVTTNSTIPLVALWARQNVLKLNAYGTTGTGITLDVTGTNDIGVGISASYGTAALTAFHSGTSRAIRLATSVAGGGGSTSYAAYAYSGAGKLYAVDGLGPFTGFHDAAIDRDTDVAVGDIVVDKECVDRQDISNARFEVEPSKMAFQRGVIGVVSEIFDTPLMKDTGDTQTPIAPHCRMIHVNGLGEGQISVCGYSGNIEVGDLIVASPVRGKGMRQLDDIVHSYTVARAREAVYFSSQDEVKLVPCIYLCG